MRIEPPPSLPIANGVTPQATEAPEPALEPPGRHVEVPGIAGRLEDRVVADGAVAELRHIGLADDDGARFLQPLDDDVVLVRREVLVEHRAHGGDQVLGRHQILDADRHAGERAHFLALRELGVDRLRHGASEIVAQSAEKAWTCGSKASMRASAASVTSAALSSLSRTWRAISTAVMVPRALGVRDMGLAPVGLCQVACSSTRSAAAGCSSGKWQATA